MAGSHRGGGEGSAEAAVAAGAGICPYDKCGRELGQRGGEGEEVGLEVGLRVGASATERGAEGSPLISEELHSAFCMAICTGLLRSTPVHSKVVSDCLTWKGLCISPADCGAKGKSAEGSREIVLSVSRCAQFFC